MNRQTEYEAMLQEIPTADLEPILAKARTKRRAVVGVRNSLLGILSVFVAFVFLVNMFPAVAYAMGRIPILKDLAKAVALSPTLSAAVENEYVQPMNIVMEDNGITLKIEYLIVDQTQVNVFYTLTGEKDTRYRVEVMFYDQNGEDLNLGSYSSPQYADGNICHAMMELFHSEVPDKVMFSAEVSEIDDHYPQTPAEESPDKAQEQRAIVARFEPVLEFDPEFTEQGEIYKLDKSFELDGQTIIVDSLEIFPTNARLVIREDEGNELELTGFDFYIRNEKGEIFDQNKNGVIAAMVDNGMAYIFDTGFFSDSEEFELVVKGARWLDKSIGDVHFDFVNETVEYLPVGAEWVDTERDGGGTELTFKVRREGDFNLHIWHWGYTDAQGTEHFNGGYSYVDDPENPEDGFLYEKYHLDGCFEDEIWLRPTHTSISTYDPPISIGLTK